jgi:hypothetical protein
MASVVKATIGTRHLFFRAPAGVTSSKSVAVTNEGTTAIYYKWEVARDLNLTLGAGGKQVSVKTETDTHA